MKRFVIIHVPTGEYLKAVCFRPVKLTNEKKNTEEYYPFDFMVNWYGDPTNVETVAHFPTKEIAFKWLLSYSLSQNMREKLKYCTYEQLKSMPLHKLKLSRGMSSDNPYYLTSVIEFDIVELDMTDMDLHAPDRVTSDDEWEAEEESFI